MKPIPFRGGARCAYLGRVILVQIAGQDELLSGKLVDLLGTSFKVEIDDVNSVWVRGADVVQVMV